MVGLGAWPPVASIALLAFRLSPPSEGEIVLSLGRLSVPEAIRPLYCLIVDPLLVSQYLLPLKAALVGFLTLGCEALEVVRSVLPLGGLWVFHHWWRAFPPSLHRYPILLVS